MTPQQLAVIHRAAFTRERPWSVEAFENQLRNPHCQVISAQAGFALVQTVADETELLTLAVHPDHQRQGIARKLVQDWLKRQAATAQRAFLDVASDNAPALSLYRQLGFETCGQRSAYYARQDGTKADAIVMQLLLPLGQEQE